MPDEHVHPIPQQDYFLQHIHDCFVYSGFNASNYGDSAVSFESVFRSLMPLIPWKLSLLCVSVSYFHPIIQICILFSPLFPPSASSVLPPFKQSWAATWAIPCCCLASWASTLVIPPYNDSLQAAYYFYYFSMNASCCWLFFATLAKSWLLISINREKLSCSFTDTILLLLPWCPEGMCIILGALCQGSTT